MEPDKEESFEFTKEQIDEANAKMQETILARVASAKKNLKKLKKYVSSNLYEINRISNTNQ